jgi:hypothetical protein
MNNENPKSANVQPDPERAKLLTVLERHNVSVESFDSLRSDSYEKHIASHSLADLDSVYSRLFRTVTDLEEQEELRESFPRWGTGSKFNGHLPGKFTLFMIKQRIMAEQTVKDLDWFISQMETLSNRLTGLPTAKPAQVFDVVVALVTEELVRDKFDGKRLLDNLPAVDRLLKAAAIKSREQQADKQNQLREQELNLKQARQLAELAVIPSKPSPPPPTQSASALTESEKTDALIERIYGLKPDGTQIQRPGDN